MFQDILAMGSGGGSGSSATMTVKNTYAHSPSNPTTFEFSEVVTITKLDVAFKLHAAGFGCQCIIQYSSDGGTTFTTLDTVTINADVTYSATTPITADVIKFVGSGGNANYMHVNGWEIEY